MAAVLGSMFQFVATTAATVATTTATPFSYGCLVSSHPSNTGVVYPANVAAVTSTNGGMFIAAGGSLELSVAFLGGDVSNLRLYATTTGQTVGIAYV